MGPHAQDGALTQAHAHAHALVRIDCALISICRQCLLTDAIVCRGLQQGGAVTPARVAELLASITSITDVLSTNRNSPQFARPEVRLCRRVSLLMCCLYACVALCLSACCACLFVCLSR